MNEHKNLRSRVFILASAFLLCAMAASLAQTVKWVDARNGSDRNDGNSEATAYASLQTALDNSRSGNAATPSLVWMKSGVYGASGLMNPSGANTAVLIRNLDHLELRAVAGDYPRLKPTAAGVISLSIVNCSHLVIEGLFSDQSISRSDNWHVFNARNLTVRQCGFGGGERGIKFFATLYGATLERNTFKNISGLYTSDALEFLAVSCAGVFIQDNYFRDNTRHIRLHEQGGNTISDVVIRRNFMIGTTDEESVRLIGAENVVVENNIIIYSAQQGIFLDAGCRQIAIRHNTFYRNRYEAIRLQAATPDVAVMNNIVYGNGTHAAFAAPASPLPNEDFNLIFNTGNATESVSQRAVTSFGANNKAGSDPLFVSAIHGHENLYLQNHSPAIAMGTDLGVRDDIERFGRTMPSSSQPDVGAYESPYPHIANPDLMVTPIAHQFGAVKIGASSTQTFKVSNTGNKELQVRRSMFVGQDSSAFVVVSGGAPFQLAVGAIRQIVVAFAPKSIGLKSAALELDCDGPNRNSAAVRLSGLGRFDELEDDDDDDDGDDGSDNIAAGFVLEQNYPNPFNPTTKIRFKVFAHTPSRIELHVYDTAGALVKALLSQTFAAGEYEVTWSGIDAYGRPVANGMYLYRMEAGAFSQTKQMLLVR